MMKLVEIQKLHDEEHVRVKHCIIILSTRVFFQIKMDILP